MTGKKRRRRRRNVDLAKRHVVLEDRVRDLLHQALDAAPEDMELAGEEDVEGQGTNQSSDILSMLKGDVRFG